MTYICNTTQPSALPQESHFFNDRKLLKIFKYIFRINGFNCLLRKHTLLTHLRTRLVLDFKHTFKEKKGMPNGTGGNRIVLKMVYNIY